ncbi:DNA-directed RNA polymerase III subunit RPC4 [Dissostichus eleginoides]|uniref:DNA-directed RNA polymerase III subunit RPC4 n=1 Tax=Dissostichus eleginoides TaxID=100907 RepID=A0AAD9BFM1_DISEL|nr:DNA-directed RNA polymerase III subunit RPC4 [Dissostichus eleginoides]
MTDSEDIASVPGCSGLSSGAGLSFPPGRGLLGRVRSLSSPAPPARLTSLKTRDLTLGGVFKKPKKSFEPNVHAVRKNKDELKEEIRTIQSHSIFEQGPADTVRKTGWRGATDLHASTTSPACKLVKKERKESEEDEDEILSKLQRDDFIDDPGLRNDEKLTPIQLPLCQPSSFSKTRTSSTCPEKPQLLQQLSLSDREELFFMQLPDSMPGRAAQKVDPPPAPAAEKPAKKEGKLADKRPAQLQAQQVPLKEGCPVLSQLPEGFLGKLQIRKSGKVELKMGQVVMDVSEGAAFSFLQQLVSVRLSDGRTGDMMVLGNVRHKLVLSPDFQALLREASPQQPQGP